MDGGFDRPSCVGKLLVLTCLPRSKCARDFVKDRVHIAYQSLLLGVLKDGRWRGSADLGARLVEDATTTPVRDKEICAKGGARIVGDRMDVSACVLWREERILFGVEARSLRRSDLVKVKKTKLLLKVCKRRVAALQRWRRRSARGGRDWSVDVEIDGIGEEAVWTDGLAT